MKKSWSLGMALSMGLAGCGEMAIDPTAQFEGVSAAKEAKQEAKYAKKAFKYLALGDSIPAGYTKALAGQYFASLDPRTGVPTPPLSAFNGYPEVYGADHNLPANNAACTGETTGSFLSRANEDNGCGQWRAAHAPMHVTYASADQSQMDFALAFLASHTDDDDDDTVNPRLVTLTIGANDLLVLQNHCSALQNDPATQAAANAAGQAAYIAALQAGKSQAEAGAAAQAAGIASVTAAVTNCIVAQMPATIGQAAANLQAILATLRGAGYTKKIIVNNYYYPTQYNAPNDLNFMAIAGLNQAIAGVVAGFKAAGDKKLALADQFTAFAAASAGNPCAVGLIAKDPSTGQCEIHPTDAGDRLLTNTVEATLDAF